jgi:hypothetical protein
VGYARRAVNGRLPFAAAERNGRWGDATQIQGTLDGADILSLSCAPAGNCTAGGVYIDRSGISQGFVASRPG